MRAGALLVYSSKMLAREHSQAALLGLGASVGTFLLIAVLISLTYSTVYAVGHGDPAWIERAQRAAGYVQGLAPLMATAGLFGGAWWLGRRADGHALTLGATLALTGWASGMASAALFGEIKAAGWALLVDVAVVGAGLALGRRGLRRERLTALATERIRRARSVDEIAEAIVPLADGRGEAAVVIAAHGSEPGLLEVMASAGAARREPVARMPVPDGLDDEAGTVVTMSEGPTWMTRGPTLWLPLSAEGEPLGVLLVTLRSAPAGRVRVAWSSLAAQVSLAWHNQRLLEETRRAALSGERERVSHQIHDTLAQDLISAVMHLETAQQQLEADRAAAAGTLARAETIVRSCLATARDLVWAQWQERHDDRLVSVIASLAERWSARSAVPVEVDAVGTEVALSPRAHALIVSTLREGLQNVHKHAAATRVRVTLSYIDGAVALDVCDDGRGHVSRDGAEREMTRGGFGLAALSERAEEMGGSLVLESEPGEGATLSLQLPPAPPTEES